MNSDVQLMDEVKTSKIFLVRCLAGCNLLPYFYKQRIHADLLDDLAPSDNPLLLSLAYS